MNPIMQMNGLAHRCGSCPGRGSDPRAAARRGPIDRAQGTSRSDVPV